MIDLKRQELGATFAYLFRRITLAEYKQHVQNGFEVKKQFDRSGYMLVNCKLYAWAYYKAKRLGIGEIPRIKDYEVRKEDARLLRKLNLSHIPKRFPAMTLSEYNGYIESIMTDPSFDLMLNKFISKKMQFIMKSYNKERRGIISTLKSVALYNIHRVYPYFESYQHMLNVGKGSATRAGHSFIKKHATQKAKRLRKCADGTSESILEPLHLVAELDLHGDKGRPAVPAIDELPVTPRVRTVLQLIAGQYDEGFSVFLGVNNVEASHTMSWASYQAQVRKYTKISKTQIDTVFEKIRERYNVEPRV